MTAPMLTFTVHGAPITQGSKTRTRYGMRDDNGAKLKPWREAVKWAAMEAAEPSTWVPFGDTEIALPKGDVQPYGGPVRVEITFTLKKPASAPKTRRTWPAKQRSGDIDKLTRAIFDAITDAGIWGDDAQVVEVTARKTYPEEHRDALAVPGAVIKIWPVT